MSRYGKPGDWGDNGKGDSVGNVAFEYICYPNQKWLKDSIFQCIKQRDDTYIQFYRYPKFGADTMSRDHAAAIILALYINRDHDDLNFVLSNLPSRLSRRHIQTPDFWLWQKYLKAKLNGNSRKLYFCRDLYLGLNILMFSLVLPFNFLLRTFLGIKKLEVEDIYNKRITGWRRMVGKLLYPDFAFFTLCWQVRVVEECFLKEILVKILEYGSFNIILQYILTGRRISENEFNTFRTISSNFWSRRWDSYIDFGIRYLDEEESRFNDINLSLLNYCYRQLDKIALEFPEVFDEIKRNGSPINY